MARRNLPGHVEHVPQVGRPVLPLRRADGDEDHRRVLDGRGQGGRERQALLGDVPPQQLLEPGLVDRHLAGLERTHLGGVLVHAHHVVPALGKAHARHEPHIASSNHRKSHITPVATTTKTQTLSYLASRPSCRTPVQAAASLQSHNVQSAAGPRGLSAGPARAHGRRRVRARAGARLHRAPRRRGDRVLQLVEGPRGAGHRRGAAARAWSIGACRCAG